MGRADIPLKTISLYLILIYIGWFATTVAISSLPDQNRLPSASAIGNVNGVSGTLAYLSQNQYYQYGTEGIITFLAVFGCYLASYGQTRQLRALALVATTWAVFNWLIYTKFTFGVLDYKSWNCGAQPVAGVSADEATRWCRVGLVSGIFSVLFEFGKVLLWGWAAFRFVQLRNVEPFCELDKSEIEYEQKKQAGLIPTNANLPPIAGTGRTLGDANTTVDPITGVATVPTAVPAALHVQSVPAGLIESDAPVNVVPGVQRITSLDQQRLSFSGLLVLFFCGLTVIGWIITTLSFIQLNRLSNQPAGSIAEPGMIGDLNMAANMFFPSLTLLFAVSFGAMMAYDRLRDNSFSPLFLNIITAMQLWSLCIYTLRRATVDPNDGTTSVAWASQRAQAAGFAIMTFSETMRIGAMVLKVLSCPPSVHPAQPEVSLFTGKLLYGGVQLLTFAAAFAWFIVMLILECIPSLFTSGTPTTPTLLDSPQSVLLWSWHNFCISLMVMSTMFAGNFYIQMAGTRSAVFSSYIGQVFVTSTWWVLCWGPAYSAAVSSGGLNNTFCGNGMSSLLCHSNRAVGIIGLVMFGTFVLNLGVSLWRLIQVDFAARSALPASELQRQGSTLTRQEALARGTMGFGDTWLTAEAFVWVSLAGWIIFSFGSTDWLREDFFILENGLANGTAFELFSFLVAHFLSVSGLLNIFIQAHIVTNKTYRDHSHGWRAAQFAAYGFQFVFSIPLLILMSRYQHLYSLDSNHKASLAGLAIFMGGQFLGLVQYLVYCIIYPAQPVTVMLPVAGQGLMYDKMGNPIVNAVPIDVEKGETLNPHHDQAGLGTNYTKTDYRHQPLNSGKDVNNENVRDINNPADPNIAAERNTAITGSQATPAVV